MYIAFNSFFKSPRPARWIGLLFLLLLNTLAVGQTVAILPGKDTAYLADGDTTIIYPLVVEGPMHNGSFPKLLIRFYSTPANVKVEKDFLLLGTSDPTRPIDLGPLPDRKGQIKIYFLKGHRPNGTIEFLTELDDGRDKYKGSLRVHFSAPKKPDSPKPETVSKKATDSLRIVLFKRLRVPIWEASNKNVTVTTNRAFGLIQTQTPQEVNILLPFVVSKEGADQLRIEVQTTDYKKYFGTMRFSQAQYPDTSIRLFQNGRTGEPFINYQDLFYGKVIKAGDPYVKEDALFESKSISITN